MSLLLVCYVFFSRRNEGGAVTFSVLRLPLGEAAGQYASRGMSDLAHSAMPLARTGKFPKVDNLRYWLARLPYKSSLM